MRRVRTCRVMGTVASVHVHDDVPVEAADAAVEAAFARLRSAEAVFSTFDPASQVSQVNAGVRHLLDCDPEVLDVLDACAWLEHTSGGAFRSRVPEHPDRLDPAGFVKGWAAECACDVLRAAGLVDWCVVVGGDLAVSGRPGPGRPWRVAVTDPRRPGGVAAVLRLDGAAAVATSGTVERGAHLWDGRNGRRCGPFLSCTVWGPSLCWADAFATTAWALGEDGPAWVARFDGYGCLAVPAHGPPVVRTADSYPVLT